MPSDLPPVLVIGGPTASGKSALALDLAEALDGVVINADSMQLYRELAILTARPDAAALARAPHRLYGVLAGAERGAAGRWRDLALAEIAAAQAAGRRPIVAGGTGLYLEALIHGLADIPPVPPEIRAEAVARHRALGGPAFHAELAQLDPVMAARLHPGDTQRLIRAWEVRAATGRSLAEWQAAPPVPSGGPTDALTFDVVVLMPPRDSLYAACDARFAAMIAAGALEEVRALVALGLDPGLPVMKALGVPPLHHHLNGEISLDEAIVQAQRDTRHYAKRQLTWFRHRSPAARGRVRRCTILNAQFSKSNRCEILSKIRQNG